jgi:ribonuclease-3 family protein
LSTKCDRTAVCLKELDNFLGTIDNDNKMSSIDLAETSPLVLAYLGDAIYEAYIRSYLVKNNRLSVHKLHKLSVGFVSATAQANVIHNIIDNLSDDEKDIVRRGRNTKSGSVPKNADIGSYRYATGFEALIGYLYLSHRHERLSDILKLSLDVAIANNEKRTLETTRVQKKEEGLTSEDDRREREITSEYRK